MSLVLATICGQHRLPYPDDDQHELNHQPPSADGVPTDSLFTKLSELLKNNGIICLLKKWDKNAKKAVGGVFSSQDWSQKNLSPKELLFSYASSSRLYPCE